MGGEPSMNGWKDPTQEDPAYQGNTYAYPYGIPTMLPRLNTIRICDVCKQYPFHQHHLLFHKVHDDGTHR